MQYYEIINTISLYCIIATPYTVLGASRRETRCNLYRKFLVPRWISSYLYFKDSLLVYGDHGVLFITLKTYSGACFCLLNNWRNPHVRAYRLLELCRIYLDPEPDGLKALLVSFWWISSSKALLPSTRVRGDMVLLRPCCTCIMSAYACIHDPLSHCVIS